MELAGLGQAGMQQQPSNGMMPNGVESNNTGQTAAGVHDNLQRQDSSSSDDADDAVAGGVSDWDLWCCRFKHLRLWSEGAWEVQLWQALALSGWWQGMR